MPKQKGIVPMSGSTSGLTYYRHKYFGDLVRTTGRTSRHELKTGENYAITRLNNEEFGRASTHGKTIRRAFIGLIDHCRDGRMNTNLVRLLKEILVKDIVSAFGKRDLDKDSLCALQHFELDQDCLASKIFDLPVETKTGANEMDIFSGITISRKPAGAVAWKLVSVAACIDFTDKSFSIDKKDSDLFLIEKGDFGIGFRHLINPENFVFHGMCIVYYGYDPIINDYTVLKGEHVNAGFLRFVG